MGQATSARDVLAFRFRSETRSDSFQFQVPGPKFEIYMQYHRDRFKNGVYLYRELLQPLIDAVTAIGMTLHGNPAKACEQAVVSTEKRRKKGQSTVYPLPRVRLPPPTKRAREAVSKVLRYEILKRDSGRCRLCGVAGGGGIPALAPP